MIIVKPLQCKHCEAKINIVNRRDADGFSVTAGWEDFREHWEREHPAEMAALNEWLDASEY